MSMYNMLFGKNPLSDVFLAVLNLTEQDCGRFRDAFVANGEIAIYTRNGGGNREHYSYDEPPVPAGLTCECTGCVIEHHLPLHPYYLRDEDDDFDCTYATVYFAIPDPAVAMLAAFDSGDFDPSDRWGVMLDTLKQNPDSALFDGLRSFVERLKQDLENPS